MEHSSSGVQRGGCMYVYTVCVYEDRGQHERWRQSARPSRSLWGRAMQQQPCCDSALKSAPLSLSLLSLKYQSLVIEPSTLLEPPFHQSLGSLSRQCISYDLAGVLKC